MTFCVTLSITFKLHLKMRPSGSEWWFSDQFLAISKDKGRILHERSAALNVSFHLKAFQSRLIPALRDISHCRALPTPLSQINSLLY